MADRRDRGHGRRGCGERRVPQGDREGRRPRPEEAELIREYRDKFSTPYAAAERGFIDDVIEPAETRTRLIKALRMLSTKRESVPARKHGNIPL